MSANDRIDALLERLNSDGGRKALALLVGRGSLDKRLDAFACELGLEQGEPGRPTEVLRKNEAINRWRAVLAFRACRSVTRDEAFALRRVSQIFRVRESDLRKWANDRRLKHRAASDEARYIDEAVVYYERNAALYEARSIGE